MKIRFIFLGKKKSSAVTQLVEQYNTRINFFLKSEIIYFNEKNNNKLESKLENLYSKKNFIICLDESGSEINSKFSEFLENKINCFNTICFLIGDSYGFNNTILDKSNYVMSLSKMTLTHLFARLLIVEQVYRSLTIINNHPYHNE